ncbi:MAG: phosphotriesterase, partial [Acidobacteria bacterium]|nr:phosphotriesterase [Acidobacteriota bacterium]
YGAAKRVGLPKYAWQETAGQLAKRWVAEWNNGLAGVKPRFIKTGVKGFPLEPIDIKLVEAAALTSLETGLPIASHTNGGGKALEAQLDILTRLKCPLDRFIWVHAQGEKDHAFHLRAARACAWCEFDGISEKSAAWHRECVLFMRDNGHLDKTLVSQDAGWYHVGEPGGGNYRGYTYIYTDFLPTFPPETHERLMVRNPLAAFGK